MRRQPKCYAHLARCHPQPRIGPYSTCDDTANATEAARGSTLLPTTAASGRASGLYPHLQLGACPMRCHTTCNAHLARRRPLPHVGPLQHIQRLSHGRARIDAAAHHGRLRGRSWRLSVSAARGASDAPRSAVPRLHRWRIPVPGQASAVLLDVLVHLQSSGMNYCLQLRCERARRSPP